MRIYLLLFFILLGLCGCEGEDTSFRFKSIYRHGYSVQDFLVRVSHFPYRSKNSEAILRFMYDLRLGDSVDLVDGFGFDADIIVRAEFFSGGRPDVVDVYTYISSKERRVVDGAGDEGVSLYFNESGKLVLIRHFFQGGDSYSGREGYDGGLWLY